MVHEDEPGFAVGAESAADRRRVVPFYRDCRVERGHRRNPVAEVLQEEVHQVQEPVGGTDFAVLGDWRLEVVGQHRDVVRIAGRLRFLERGELSDRVRAAVVHVVTGQIAAASDLDECGRVNVERPDDVASVVGAFEAAAELAGRKGIAFVGHPPAVASRPVDWHQVRADGGVVPHPVEEEMRRGRERPRAGVPRRVAVAAEDRQHARERDARTLRGVPACGGEERRVHAAFDGDRAERIEMGCVAGEFVFKLESDDRAAVGIEEAAEFLPDRAVPAADLGQIAVVVRAEPERFFHEPVGESAIAGFAVDPGAGTDDDFEALFLRLQHEVADREVAGEVEFAFDFLMMDPEKISRNDRDAARLQFRELGGPLFAGHAREMKLAHDRDPRFAVPDEIQAVYADGAAAGIRPAEIEVVREDFRLDERLERAADRLWRIRGLVSPERRKPGICCGKDCGGHKKRSCQVRFHWAAPGSDRGMKSLLRHNITRKRRHGKSLPRFRLEKRGCPVQKCSIGHSGMDSRKDLP